MFEVAKATLAKSTSLAEAAASLSVQLARPITVAALQTVFRDHNDNAGLYLAAGRGRAVAEAKTSGPRVATAELPAVSVIGASAPPPTQRESEASASPQESTVDDLVALARKFQKRGGLTLQLAADALNLSPRKTIELFQSAQRDGRTIDYAHNEIVWRMPESPRVITDIAPPTPGEERAIGVFSDVHAGSVYHLGAELGSFVNRAYDAGIRDFFCPGDLVEGCYKHARWELSAQSQDDQHDHFLAALPMRAGMRVFFIDGNHDQTWTEKNGTESGRALVRLAREQGRNDLHFLGTRGAMVNYGGTRIELWHPKKGAAYALSYQLQNKIRDTAVDRLPDILLTGHTHQYVKLRRQNVWAFYCGTFQHGDGPYGRALGGDTAMGGVIMRWRKDPDGIVRRFSDDFQVIDRQRGMHHVEVA